MPDGSTKSLIELSWLSASNINGIDRIYVATDDERIRDEANLFGADVIMTSTNCENGTVRCAEAISQLDYTPDIVVNFQGDAPLTPPWFVESLLSAMRTNSEIGMATPVLRCTSESHALLVEERRQGRVGATTVVVDSSLKALYFSKEVLPFISKADSKFGFPVFHHVGVYAYTVEALSAYACLDTCALEMAEGLEQLRFLYNQIPVQCVEVQSRGRVFWELNNPSDVGMIEAALRQLNECDHN